MADIVQTIAANQRKVRIAEVKAGEIWQFETEGEWTDWYVRCGPEGYRSFLFHVLDVWPRCRPEPYFCVVGIVDDDDDTMFRIGAGTSVEFKKDGVLYAFANDHQIAYWNNSGEITIRARKLKETPHAPEPVLLRGWALVRQVLDRTKGVGFVAALTLGVCLALALTPQGRDLIRTVGEDDLGSPRQMIFGVMLLFLAMQAWFWPRVIISFHYGSDRRLWRPGWFLQWLPRVLGVAPFLLTFVAMVRNPSSNTAGSAAILVLGLLFFVFVLVRQDVQRLPGELGARLSQVFMRSAANRPKTRTPRPGRAWVVFGLALAALSMLLFSADPVTVPRLLGPPAVVFLGVGLLIPPLVILIQSGASFRFPALTALLVAAVVFSLWLDNHQVGRRARQALLQAPTARPTLEQAYVAWKSQFGEPQSGQPLSMVLVAAEGGASRAGFWTGEVLAALERESAGEFGKHLFAINSISGGSVGAVGYAAALNEMPDKPEPRTEAELLRMEQRIQRFSGADALSPVAAGLLFPDLLQRFVPFNLPTPDRAEALERSWENAWASDCPAGAACKPELIRAPYLDLWRNPLRRWTPAVIVNGASEETGRRILTSPIALPLVAVGSSDDGRIDADDFHDITGTDVPASTAIHNGARFPYVSPAGTLRAEGGRNQHILDGGYFDGAGIESTRQLAISLAILADRAGDNLTITIVYIGYKAGPAPPSGRLAGNEVLAPLIGMVGSRSAHQTHMWRQAYGTASKRDWPWVRYREVLLKDDPKCQPQERQVFQDPFTMPMDWALSERAKTIMRWNVGFAKLPWDQPADCKDVTPEVKAVISSMRTPVAQRPPPPRSTLTVAPGLSAPAPQPPVPEPPGRSAARGP